MSSNDMILQARDLTRSFESGGKPLTVVRRVSLELFSHQFALLMGPSGSGKSTLLALLSGLLHPDGGQVVVLGEDLWRKSEQERREFRLRHFGFIFQGYNLFPSLTAREQLEMVSRWGQGLRRQEARRRANEMLDLLGLTVEANKLPAQLSGGEKQRVAIGRALMKDAAFCFADEPTAALDWTNGEKVIQMLEEAARHRGATVLVVAHDARIVPFADRVFYMEDGQVTEQEVLAGHDLRGAP